MNGPLRARSQAPLASLNHPNIAAIYGLEQAGGKRFIVMELVKGATLEAAHEKGEIHRGPKPANVMITAGEKVKILDFGLEGPL